MVFWCDPAPQEGGGSLPAAERKGERVLPFLNYRQTVIGYLTLMALPRVNRLRASSEVGAAVRRGRIVSNELATMRYFARSTEKGSRFVFIVPKKIAKRSVLRNKIRRRAAEWVRKHQSVIAGGHDVAFIFRKPSTEATRSNFYCLLAQLFVRANLIS